MGALQEVGGAFLHAAVQLSSFAEAEGRKRAKNLRGQSPWLSWQPLLSSQLHFCNLSSFLAGQLSRGIGKSPYCMGMGLCVLLLTLNVILSYYYGIIIIIIMQLWLHGINDRVHLAT